MPITVIDGTGKPVTVASNDDVIAGLAQSRLVMLPIGESEEIALASTSNAVFNNTYWDNEDGSGMAIKTSIPAAPTNTPQSVVIRRTINGNIIGLRIGLSFVNENAPFGAIVDGMPIPCNWKQEFYPELQTKTSHQGHSRNVILGTNFGDGPHDVRVVFPFDYSITNQSSFYGWLADRNAGYVERPRGIILNNRSAAQLTLTTTNATLVPQGGTDSQRYPTMLGFYYRNTSGATAVISILPSLGGTAQAAMQTISVAAGASGYFAFPGPLAGGIFLQADTANAFVITPVGQN